MRCQTPLCDKPAQVTDLCRPHYRAILLDFNAIFRRMSGLRYFPSTEDRFFANVVEGASGCWVWTAPLDRGGYGHIRDENGRRASAHRWAYRFLRGDIPDGLQLDHLCRNRACVNPWHLEPVTLAENLRRGAAARRSDVCKHGHKWADGNEYVTPRGGRACRACGAIKQRRHRARIRAA